MIIEPHLPKKKKRYVSGFYHLRDDRVVVGGQGVSLRVHKRRSEIEEQVAEQRPDALRKENLQAGDDKRGQKMTLTFFFSIFAAVMNVLLAVCHADGFGAHRRPANLRAEIPEVHGDGGADWQILQDLLVFEAFLPCNRRSSVAFTVRLLINLQQKPTKEALQSVSSDFVSLFFLFFPSPQKMSFLPQSSSGRRCS